MTVGTNNPVGMPADQSTIAGTLDAKKTNNFSFSATMSKAGKVALNVIKAVGYILATVSTLGLIMISGNFRRSASDFFLGTNKVSEFKANQELKSARIEGAKQIIAPSTSDLEAAFTGLKHVEPQERIETPKPTVAERVNHASGEAIDHVADNAGWYGLGLGVITIVGIALAKR